MAVFNDSEYDISEKAFKGDRSKKRMSVFIFAICSILGISFAYEEQRDKFHFARRIKTDNTVNTNAYIFDILTEKGITDCIESCKARKLCKFINYHHRAKVCYLIGVRIEESLPNENYLEVKPGFYSGDKREWNMDEHTVCEGCNRQGVCNNVEDKDYPNDICLASGCEPPVNKENAIFLGNMFSIGNMIRYICIKGYKTKNKVPLTSTCLDNGTWSSVELTCLPEVVFGTDIYEFNNTYYKLVQMEQDWESAKATCDGMGLHLVDIKYQEEQLFITDNIVHDYDCYWTGGRRRNDQLVWLDGTDIAASNGWNWGNNQPSNYGGSQNCITLKDYNGYKWNDKSCSDQCYVICELAQ